MNYKLEKIGPVIEKIYKNNIKVKKGEKILVINDFLKNNRSDFSQGKLREIKERETIARKMFELGKRIYGNIDLILYPIQIGELPCYVSNAMNESDVVIAPTTYSISHTKATKETAKNKGRVVSMPSVTIDMFLPEGPMDADYTKISEITKKVCYIGEKSKNARIVAPGTELSLNIGRKWVNDDGIFEPMEFGNLPAGEGFTAPIEGSAEGYCTISKGWGSKQLTENMRIQIEKGYVVSIRGGGKKGDEIRKTLNFNKNRKAIAEFAIGTNDKAKNIYKTLEAEKMLGTAHIAFGNNIVFGGNNKSDVHIDEIMQNAEIYLDDLLVLKNGKLLI